MANQLSRLKWIPMLVRAYDEARTRVTTTKDPNGTTSAAQVESDISTAHGEGSKKRRAVRRPVAQKHRPVSLQRSVPRNEHVPSSRSAKASEVQSVLRELRDTKRKLKRLESIHEQLNRMQQHLDGRLVQLMQEMQQMKPVQVEDHDPAAGPTMFSEVTEQKNTHSRS